MVHHIKCCHEVERSYPRYLTIRGCFCPSTMRLAKATVELWLASLVVARTEPELASGKLLIGVMIAGENSMECENPAGSRTGESAHGFQSDVSLMQHQVPPQLYPFSCIFGNFKNDFPKIWANANILVGVQFFSQKQCYVVLISVIFPRASSKGISMCISMCCSLYLTLDQ